MDMKCGKGINIWPGHDVRQWLTRRTDKPSGPSKRIEGSSSSSFEVRACDSAGYSGGTSVSLTSGGTLTGFRASFEQRMEVDEKGLELGMRRNMGVLDASSMFVDDEAIMACRIQAELDINAISERIGRDVAEDGVGRLFGGLSCTNRLN
jgi:hypothetical protein